MEIKHTIEILTKDIQDIEKLVRNLNNYTTPPQIELDLAMSKLRRIYELLSMISSDIKSDRKEMELEVESKQSDDSEQIETVKSTHTSEIPTPEQRPGVKEKVAEPVITKKTEIEVTKEEQVNIEENEETEPILQADPDMKEPLSEEPVAPEKKRKEASILAEKFEADTSLNEKIAPGMNSNISTKIKGGPIDSIKRNIGINDRFLIIRELMNGDNEGFIQIIQRLDDCTNFNEAFKHIQSRFSDDLEHEGVKILINLSRRKFITRGNV
jgi:hypothetical protein